MSSSDESVFFKQEVISITSSSSSEEDEDEDSARATMICEISSSEEEDSDEDKEGKGPDDEQLSNTSLLVQQMPPNELPTIMTWGGHRFTVKVRQPDKQNGGNKVESG
jgi:hypothetical protein